MLSINNTDIEWSEITNPEAVKLTPIENVVEGYAARGLVTVMGGSGGSGKSLLNQYLFQKRDNSILPTKDTGFALYLTGADTSQNELVRRVHAIGKNRGLMELELPDFTLPFISDFKFFNSLIKQLQKLSFDSVIFDTLADFHHGNLIDAVDANETMQAFRSLASKANVAVIIITHTRKGSKIKTRYDIEDISDSRISTTKADIVYGLKSEYQSQGYNLVEMQCLKNRVSKPIKDLRLSIFENSDSKQLEILRSDDLFSYEFEDQRKVKEREEKKRLVKELKEEGLSYRDIADKTGISKSTVANLLKEV